MKKNNPRHMLIIRSETQNILANAVKLMMETIGWKETSKEEDAELIILVPPSEDLQKMLLTDIKMIRQLLPGPSKRVLLFFRAQKDISGFLTQKNDWFYPFGILSHSDRNGFFEWIQKREEAKDDQLLPPTLQKYRELALSLLCDEKNASSSDFENLLIKVGFDGDLKHAASGLMSDDKLSEFFLSLQRISRGYDQHEHNMNNKHSDIFTDVNAQDYLQTQQQKQLIDFFSDLNRTLRVYRPCREGKYILIIEDNPEKIRNKLKAIQDVFFGKDKIFLLNPRDNEHEKLINYLASYNSLSSSLPTTTKSQTELINLFDSTEKKTFDDIKNNIRFALVDILLLDQPIGIAVISGLLRFFHDNDNDNDKADVKPLDIIAISRADDIEKIYAAMRAGACGYVLKSRLLTIPAIVGETAGARHEPVKTLKQNFRSLYKLPNDTIRLLRNIPIPYRNEVSSFKKEQAEEYLNMAKLLRKIPKPDLHVHVASCMTPEFLITASLIMLARHKKIKDITNSISTLITFFYGKKIFRFQESIYVQNYKKDEDRILAFYGDNREIISELAASTRDFLKTQIKEYINNRKDHDISVRYKGFRSVLHKKLGMPDHLNEDELIKKIDGAFDVTLFQFAMISSGPQGKPCVSDKDDIVRIFLLYLAGRKDSAQLNVCGHEWLQFFRYPFPSKLPFKTNIIFNAFWKKKKKLSFNEFRKKSWSLPLEFRKIIRKVKVNLSGSDQSGTPDLLANCPRYEENPVAWLLASGTRSLNLKSYLEGCEYAGAEHLRHPFLIHLYAQQTVQQFIEHGVLYAELRAAVSGYEFRHNDDYFTFQDACNCLKAAFENAQKITLDNPTDPSKDGSWLWAEPFGNNKYPKDVKKEKIKIFPTKVSIILTGKRHKPTKQILREAASAIVLQNQPLSKIKSSKEFCVTDIAQCRIVGFDLAGQEDGYPPNLFSKEFSYLSQMHVPITVHAGENAPAEFVESAILDLRARRLGHGLALAEDPRLMNQVRETGVCVELCPMSNYQTNQFHESGREYPLKAFLENGNSVCLNTDNPSISYTNIIKECFQASFAYGGSGLTLWELLRIFRMGFTNSFLTIPEKRAMLELVDQILFDLFTEPDVKNLLNSMDNQ